MIGMYNAVAKLRSGEALDMESNLQPGD